jgi:hypothetical protein
MGKSAEVIDDKGVEKAPLCKRVRKRMKRKTLEEDTVFVGIGYSRLSVKMSGQWPFIVSPDTPISAPTAKHSISQSKNKSSVNGRFYLSSLVGAGLGAGKKLALRAGDWQESFTTLREAATRSALNTLCPLE